jgi:hypothetical protein
MDAYLICELVDKNQALEVDDFAQTIKENQQLMKLGKGVRFTCIKDINEIKTIKTRDQPTRSVIPCGL